MSAGTLALTNNSTTVTGTNTVFQTDLAANDFIVCKIGGTTYTLGVSAVGSNTALTLTQPFTGPTTSGVAWTAVANQALVGITTELAANLTTVYRSVIRNDANWMQFFSNSGNVNITLRDGTTVTGPSWNSVSASLGAKANTDDVLTKADNLASVADKAVARTNMGLAYGTAAGTVAQGNDSRLNTVNNKSGGSLAAGSGLDIISNTFSNPATGTFLNGVDFRSFINGRGAYGDSRGAFFGMRAIEQVGSSVFGVLQYNGWSVDRFWRFYSNGNAEATAGNWVNTSDERLKTNKQIIKDPLSKMRLLRGYSWDRLDDASPGYGFLAQELEKVFPDAVFEGGSRKLKDGTVIEKVKNVELAGPSAALHHESILTLMAIIESMGKRLHDLDGLDA